jgi:hypothetical protein
MDARASRALSAVAFAQNGSRTMANRRTAIAGTVLTLAVCAVATARAQMPERCYREKATPTQRDFAQ